MNVCLLFVCWALSCLCVSNVSTCFPFNNASYCWWWEYCSDIPLFPMIERNYIDDIAVRVGRYQEPRAAHVHE